MERKKSAAAAAAGAAAAAVSGYDAMDTDREMVEVLDLAELLAEVIEQQEVIESQRDTIERLGARVATHLADHAHAPVQPGVPFELRSGTSKHSALKDEVRNVLVDLLAKVRCHPSADMRCIDSLCVSL